MKKILLKIIIIIVALPTAIIGGLYITREISVVSKYVISPLAQLSRNIGLPVIVMPSDSYFKEEAREVYDEAVRRYNMWDDKESMIIGEEQAKAHNSEGVTIYQNYNVGVSYAELQIKPYEEFEKEWIEYSKAIYKKNKANMTQENINKAQEESNKVNEQIEKQKKLTELYQELQNAQINKNTGLAEQIQKQIDELENQEL